MTATSTPTATWIPGYILLEDADGLRHVVRVSSIQMLSDSDQCRDATVAVVAGRGFSVPVPLDELLGRLRDCEFRGRKAPWGT